MSGAGGSSCEEPEKERRERGECRGMLAKTTGVKLRCDGRHLDFLLGSEIMVTG